MICTSVIVSVTGITVLMAAWESPVGPSNQVDPRLVDENLRKVQTATAFSDSTLGLLSRSSWVGIVLKGAPDWRAADTFLSTSAKSVADLKKQSDRLVELAQNTRMEMTVQKEARSFLGKISLVRLGKQADELTRLAKEVRSLPVGLVSDQVDDKFKVSGSLLIKNPKAAEIRYRSYLSAMRANLKFLASNQKTLEGFAQGAKEAGQVIRKMQEGIEKAMPAAGPYGRSLTELYLDLDKVAKAYNELAADCAARSRLMKRAAEVEQKRHDNLKATVKTLFGFDG